MQVSPSFWDKQYCASEFRCVVRGLKVLQDLSEWTVSDVAPTGHCDTRTNKGIVQIWAAGARTRRPSIEPDYYDL